MVRSPGKRPQTISDPDLMQQGACLVEMKPDPKIEVAPVIISAPEVEEVHRSTALSAAKRAILLYPVFPRAAMARVQIH
jgi:hypothetical protein